MEKRPLNQLQEKKSLSCTTLVRSISLSSFFFSEPFDAASWMLVGLAAVQISAFSIFLFEWLSPAGYDMKVRIKGGFPAYFSTLIKFPRNNKKIFNFMTTSILPFFVIKKVKFFSFTIGHFFWLLGPIRVMRCTLSMVPTVLYFPKTNHYKSSKG